MKKAFYIIIIILFSKIDSIAQYGQIDMVIPDDKFFGIKANYVRSNLKIIEGMPESVTEGGHTNTYQFGVYGRIQSDHLFFQPSLIYSNTNGTFLSPEVNGWKKFVARFDWNTIDMPLLGGYRNGVFRIGIGPVFSFMINNDYKLTTTSDDVPAPTLREGAMEDWAGVSVLGRIGIGFDFRRWAIDLQYDRGLTNFYNGVLVEGLGETTLRRNQWVAIGVGFKLVGVGNYRKGY